MGSTGVQSDDAGQRTDEVPSAEVAPLAVDRDTRAAEQKKAEQKKADRRHPQDGPQPAEEPNDGLSEKLAEKLVRSAQQQHTGGRKGLSLGIWIGIIGLALAIPGAVLAGIQIFDSGPDPQAPLPVVIDEVEVPDREVTSVTAAVPATPAVSIRNVIYPGGPGEERVEFVNTTGESLDMSLWTLHDDVRVRYTFPIGFELPAGREVWVWTGVGGDIVTDANIWLFAGSGNAFWNEEGDTATLRDAEGNELDTWSYSR